MFEHDFIKDFDRLFNEKEPFAFVRFHDGEHAILEGIPYRAASKWTSAGGDVWIRDELKEVLHTQLDRFFIGVSPPCCAPQATHYYRTKLPPDASLLTFATLFQYKNFRRMKLFKERFKNALFVGSGEADINVPQNGVVKEWDVDVVVDEMLKSDRPVFVAAGPCANIIIYRYWKRQDPVRRQTVVDVGAAFDVQIHRQETRDYHKRTNAMASHVCAWDTWQPFGLISDSRRRELEDQSKHKAKYKQLSDQGFGAVTDQQIRSNTGKPKPKLVKSFSETLQANRTKKRTRR